MIFPFLFFLLCILHPDEGWSAKRWEVCSSGCELTSIQEAYKKANSGDHIHVKAGVYQLSELLVQKPVSFFGEKGAILQGNGQSEIMIVQSPHVTIDGFQIQGSGKSYIHDVAAVRFDKVKNAKFSNNQVHDAFFGVYFGESEDSLIENNQFLGPGKKEIDSGDAVHIWHGKNFVVRKNQMRGHRDGIYLEFVTTTLIEDNRSWENIRYGLHFMFSNENHFYRNYFGKNEAGVAIMYSQKIIVEDNVFEESRGSAAYGALLKDISGSQIRNNHIRNNTIGLYMEGSNRSIYQGNKLEKNGFAIRILGDCEDNQFEQNSFRGNTADLTTNSSHNSNQFAHNYWDRYRGLDLNRDGYGDLPYRPAKISGQLVERHGMHFFLWGSFFFQLLDFAEELFPDILPATLVDMAPRMKP